MAACWFVVQFKRVSHLVPSTDPTLEWPRTVRKDGSEAVSTVRDVVLLRATDRDVSGGDWRWPRQVFSEEPSRTSSNS